MRAPSHVSFVLASAAAALFAHVPAIAAPSAPAEPPVPAMPLDLVVASPLVTDAFVDEQLAALPAVYRTHDLSFKVAHRRAWPSSAIAPVDRPIETRADRDALVSEFHPGAANVFFVASLEDVDEPGRHRFGVCWRNEREQEKRYVIVASYAPRGVLAHELGHLLGLPHSAQPDNVMSYTRTGTPPFFIAAQGATMRQTARAYFASGFFLH